MSESRQFKYAESIATSGFSKALAAKVDAYFAARGIGRHANGEMVAKTVLGFALWIATWIWLMRGHHSPLGVVGVYVVHGFAQLHIAFNVAHDANHGAFSRRKGVNRLLACTFDLVGASSYMWRLMHNDSHHAFVNVRGADSTFISGQIFRFSPEDRVRPYHRFQHLYAPLIYSLSTLDWTLTKDFRWLFRATRFGNRRLERHPASELIVLFAGKAFYFAYTLVLPLIFLDTPWYAVIAGFVVMHLFLGFTIALIFQPNHFNEESTFPQADEEGHIANNYIRHIFDTTSDYARGNPFACWILGCLNLHVIHHMFPQICHVHYPALTRMVEETAGEYGLVYRENRTISGAFLAHLRWLRILGRGEENVRPTPIEKVAAPASA